MTMPAPVSARVFWCKQLDQRQFELVVGNVAKALAKMFVTKRDVLMKALHLRNLPPEGRLVHYRMRAPDMWLVLERAFPQRYVENMRDWYALESKNEAGELDPVKIEEAYAGAIQVLEDEIAAAEQEVPAPPL